MDLQVGHAAAMLDAGRPAEALRLIGGWLAENPDDVEALNIAGQALSDLGRHRQAIDTAAHAVRVAPDDARSWATLAAVRRSAGDIGSAINAARRVVELVPSDWSAHTNLSHLYVIKNPGGEGAVREADEAVRLAPNVAQTHLTLGTALLGQRLTKPAIESFTTALRLDPQNEYARHNLAVARIYRGDPARAVTDLASLAGQPSRDITTLPALRVAIGKLLAQIHTAVFVGALTAFLAGMVGAFMYLNPTALQVGIFVISVLCLAVVVALLLRTRIVLGSALLPVLRFVIARDRLIAAWAMVDAIALLCVVLWPLATDWLGSILFVGQWLFLCVGLIIRIVRSVMMRTESGRG